MKAIKTHRSQQGVADCGAFIDKGNMEILYKDKQIVAINKPVGVSSAEDVSGSENAMTLTSSVLDLMGENSDLWLVHRLDNVTGGVLVFARSKTASSRMSELFSSSDVLKEYFAVVEGSPSSDEITDYLVRDSVSGKAKVVDKSVKGAKLAHLRYENVETVNDSQRTLSLLRICLDTGRFHQIRAQFSAKGHPLVGDGKYGSRVKTVRTPALFCCRIAFFVGKEEYDISAVPNFSLYPWNLFDKKNFGAK